MPPEYPPITVPVYFYEDEDTGKDVIDTDSMRAEFERKLTHLEEQADKY